jgi:hypothetical protein
VYYNWHGRHGWQPSDALRRSVYNTQHNIIFFLKGFINQYEEKGIRQLYKKWSGDVSWHALSSSSSSSSSFEHHRIMSIHVLSTSLPTRFCHPYPSLFPDISASPGWPILPLHSTLLKTNATKGNRSHDFTIISPRVSQSVSLTNRLSV